ncbi:MAG TPA: PepSY-associated TM helix domain-containing protein [Acidobacteriaceae bacterium]|nr:PepSY-associated TM helix domain-containing protein [Acidobacteriaceae bacterium]
MVDTGQAALHHFTVERPYGMAYISSYGAYTYCVRSSLDFRGHGWDTSVLIDGTTGQFRSVDLPRGQHLGNTISTLLWGIHYGDLRDFLPFRILMFGFGFFLSALSITGVIIWWKKRGVRKLAASRQRSAGDKQVGTAIPDLHEAQP